MPMKHLSAAALLPAILLVGCGSNGVEPEGADDTSYEQQLPSPVEQTRADDAPVERNDTVAGGADEQVDAVVAEEVNETAGQSTAGRETGGSTTTR